MKVKNQIKLLGAAIVLTSAAAAVSLYQGNYSAEHFATTTERADKMVAASGRLVMGARYGLEPGSAGLHIILPFPEDSPFGQPPSSNESLLGDWDFRSVGVAYPLGVDYSDSFGEELGALFAGVSTETLVPNGIFSYQMIEGSGEKWEIQATVSQRGIDILSALHGPVTSSTDFEDWTGVVQDAGDSCTDMRLVVVADNVAYLPVSVTQLIQQPAPQTFVVMSELSQEDAFDFARKLSN